MMKTPLALYREKIQSGLLVDDSFQGEIVLLFEKLFHEMVASQKPLARFKNAFCQRLKLKQKPVRGIYLWGTVGRGKTVLMDMFFHLLPFAQKERFHFHRFMQHVHQQLKTMQGESEPLYLVAKAFKTRTNIICFDEFYVTDIADAMILAELFRHLFALGVTLVATSNIKPDDLYPNGLQRDKFIPTISLIKENTLVIAMDGNTDYRMQYLAHTQLYQYPADDIAEQNLMTYFQKLAAEEGLKDKKLRIVDRDILSKWCAENIVWFDFNVLCGGPRSTLDYIQIARDFKTVLLSHVALMNEANEDVARRFIALVDEFYDHKVTLIVSAHEPLSQLYQGKRHATDFQRTISRLTEMQSLDYLQQRHLP
ncbi:MAG: cell division protein ZapE [Candidatus Berkiella sp.]